ncbi:MAG TPA: hypothetical protein VLB76_01335 [Thermoanaerobaculia bacterium]|jgi:hypothetical protein|nr:hypothetical protein [Thermoanaerobaculia bacterium]
MTLLSQSSAFDALKWPTSTSRDLLASLHGGDVLRQTLPQLLRIGIVIWFSVYTFLWIFTWPGIYQEFERSGLVKAFFAQLIALASAFLAARITILRAQHLATLPADDFVSLRAASVLSRWLGEVALIYVVGAELRSLLQPVGAVLNSFLGKVLPSAASAVSEGTSSLLLVSAPFALFWVSLAAAFFLFLYTVANAIDLSLAIEFNTRAERMGQRAS